MSKSTPTVIITHSVLLRQGIASLLQGTSYKVISIAAEPAELPIHCCPKGQRALAIFGIDRGANLAGTADRVHLLRALMPDGKLVLLVETDGSIDPWLMAELCPDACIFDLGSRDALIRILELTFMKCIVGQAGARFFSEHEHPVIHYNDLQNIPEGYSAPFC